MTESKKDSNNAILYDINTYTYPSWASEQDFNKNNSVYPKYPKNQISSYNYLFKLGSWAKKLFNSNANEDTLKFLFASSKPWNEWKLAVSETGSFALLKDNVIEFYESLNELTWRIEVRTQLIKICNIFFNERADMLVFTEESGSFYFYDITNGNELFRYIEPESIELENSICKMIFLSKEILNYQNLENDIVELLMTVSFSGYFNVYSIKSNKTVEKIFTQSMLSKIPNGIYCAEIDAKSEYLIIGSFASYASTKQLSNGISIWRILNQEPWIKHVDIVEGMEKKDFSKSKNNQNKMNFSKIEYVTKIVISPDNSSLAAIYVSGKLAIYSFPSLRIINEWFMTEQPCYNDMNSDILENPYELKKFKQIYHEADFRLVDVGWWNEKVLILVRGSGLLSLVSSDDFSNLMGSNQQWLNPFPSIYMFLKNEFVILDCSCAISNQAFYKYDTDGNEDDNSLQNLNESYEINNNSDDFNDDDEDDSWYSYFVRGIRLKAYNLIGIELLNVPIKKTKFLRRKFSLLHIKSTTPEELFERKLQSEEYGEALQLAKAYNLDADLVYQKQWRSKPITKSTIIDYLSKIKKRNWILHECEERVSTNIETMKYLIEFGFCGTDLDALIAIKEIDDNKFFYNKIELSDDFDDAPIDKFNPQQVQRKKKQIEEMRKEKLKMIDPKNLTLMQKELCMTRLKLLTYLDRLEIYERILGGPIKAVELFDCEKYKEIRTKSILEVTLDYAREGNANAVEILFSYYHQELKDKQLYVLSNFPETLEPEVYAKLLPKIENGQIVTFEEPEELRSEKDWIEYPEFQEVYAQYKKHNETNSTTVTSLDVESIQKWFYNRIVEIENLTGLIDVALSFAELAIVNGCKNINELIENLRTLFTLIYECKPSDASEQDQVVFYNLDYITKLTDLEKLSLIMSHSYKSSHELYVKNLQEWLLPFISRRPTLNQRETLLKEFLLQTSKEDLQPCVKLINLKVKYHNMSQSNQTQQLAQAKLSHLNLLQELNVNSILLECLYVNDNADQLALSQQIINDLCKLSLEPGQQSQLKSPIIQTQQEQIKLALEHIKACELFKKYGVNKSLSYIKKSCSSLENCRDALVKLTWFASKKTTQLKLNEWIDLMKDLKYLQASLYKNLITYRECTEIFLTSLLGSRNLENIKLAADWLKDVYIVDKEAAIQLAIKASQEYFNAASNYLDPDMEFSRACLNLVETMVQESKSQLGKTKTSTPDNNIESILENCLKQIRDEYNLIQAMKLIADFEYNILPVQIRLSENRLDILKDILEKKENAYRSYDRLIELGALLNVSKNLGHQSGQSESEMLPQVRQLIAEHALKKRNISIAKKMCVDLIQSNYGSAWPCVYNLAYSLGITLIEQYEIEKIKDNVFLSIANFKFDQKQIKTTKLLENMLKIEEFLSFVLTYCDIDCVQEVLYQKMNIENARNRIEFNNEINQLGDIIDDKFHLSNVHKFYLKNDKSINDEELLQAKNNSISLLLQKLIKLRALNLKSNENLKLFKQITNNLATLDASVLFSSFLELDEANLSIFEDLDSFKFDSPLSYEFFLHLLGLNIIQQKSSRNIYHFKPSTINEYILNLELNDDSSYSRAYKSIEKLYSEFNHKTQLQNLNQNIDLNRFEIDTTYRNETILGLSDDLHTFKLACSLAKFYSVDLWEVYMSFTKNLFLDYEHIGLSLEELESNIKPLLPVLNRKFESFSLILSENILSKIDGKNLDKLVTYYKILNDQDSQTHVKLLKKLKSADFVSAFDYKKFMEKPLEAIEPFLDDSNVQFFSKLVAKLPAKHSNVQNLSSSKINVVWCLKNFWSKNGNSETNKENLSAPGEILDSMAENVKRLDLETDVPYFVNELTLSRRSTTKLSLQVRKDLLKRIGKLFKQTSGDKLDKCIQKIQAHLKLMESLDKCIGENKEYLRLIDFELGNFIVENLTQTNLSEIRTVKLEEILVQILFDSAYSIEKIDQLIRVLGLKENTNVKKLIKLGLNKISSLLLLKQENCSTNLNTLLETISNYLNTSKTSKLSGAILNDEDVMECMRVFCNDQQIDINTRLFILEKLKKIIKSMNEDDLILLLVYKTNAILANCDFFGKKIELINSGWINSEKKRLSLLQKWLDYAHSTAEYSALFNLIRIWPTFTDENPLIFFLTKLMLNNNDMFGILSSVLDDEEKSLSLCTENLKILKSNLENEKTQWTNSKEAIKRNFLKLCLIFKSSENLDFVMAYLNSAELNCFKLMDSSVGDLDLDQCESYENLMNDKEVFTLISRENFYCNIVNTKFYTIFLKYLINNKTKQELLDVVRVLKRNSHNIEAANLLITTENFFPPYKNLSTSLALSEKFS